MSKRAEAKAAKEKYRKEIRYVRLMLKFQRKSDRKKAEAKAKERARQERALQRHAVASLTKITHLRRRLAQAVQFPSLMTAAQLRDIALNSELPAEARVEAARLLQQWLFAEPSELEAGNGPIRKRGRAGRRD